MTRSIKLLARVAVLALAWILSPSLTAGNPFYHRIKSEDNLTYPFEFYIRNHDSKGYRVRFKDRIYVYYYKGKQKSELADMGEHEFFIDVPPINEFSADLLKGMKGFNRFDYDHPIYDDSGYYYLYSDKCPITHVHSLKGDNYIPINPVKYDGYKLSNITDYNDINYCKVDFEIKDGEITSK